MALSNTLLSILNFLTALISLPIIAFGIYLAIKHSSECVRLLRWPIIVLGVFILLVSLAGFVGSCWRVTSLLFVYLAIVFLLILLVIAFTVVAFVVTNKGAGHLISGKGYKEYRLGDYSTWLQRNVDKASNWKKIKSCLVDSKVCNSLQKEKVAVTDFYNANLSPIQSGCCKPPTACGFTYASPTSWKNPTNITADPDCNAWNNDPSELCFDCNSCRAGVLQNAKQDWKKAAIVNAAVLVILIAAYSLGCCAFRNSRRQRRARPIYYVKA